MKARHWALFGLVLCLFSIQQGCDLLGSAGPADDSGLETDGSGDDTNGTTAGDGSTASNSPGPAGNTPASTSPASEPNSAPTAFVNVAHSALPGSFVVLDGSDSSDPDGDTLTYAWRQLAGPAVNLAGELTDVASFTMPDAPAGTPLTFQLTVSDGRLSAYATGSIQVVLGALVKSVWDHGLGNIDVDVDWLAPSGARLQVNRSGWGPEGTEWAFVPVETIAPGLHWLTLQTRTFGRSATLDYSVDFLNYHYRYNGPIVQDAIRAIGLDVQDGQARVVFNGWLHSEEPGSGGPSGFNLVEVQHAWRDANDQVRGDTAVYMPNGDRLASWDHGWALQGFDRAVVPFGIELADGTWMVELGLSGSGRNADVTCDILFPGYEFHHQAIEQAPSRHIVVLDVHEETARVLFNGFLAPAESGAGGPTGLYPLEFMAGWRNANDVVDGDVYVILPSGARLDVWQHGWALEGFERSFVPAGTALPNGTYRLRFEFQGAGRSAEITVHARLFNYAFTATRQMLGNASQEIELSVQDGVVFVVNNTWAN